MLRSLQIRTSHQITLMNEEISVTIKNNTPLVQPVTLFTEIFNIPSNIVGSTYTWDISGESYFYGIVPPTINVQYDTVPITGLTPYTTATLPTNDIAGVVSALNSLNIGTFASSGNVIYVSSSIYFFGNLILSPSFYTQVVSSIPNGLPAIEIFRNAVSIQTVASGISTVATTSLGSAGDTIVVNYSSGVTATNWNITIDWYQPNNVITNIYTDFGVGANFDNHTFFYPAQGNIVISFLIT
jgi:hypothetical protein